MARIIGVGVFAVGAILVGFAFHSTNAPLERLSDTITGRYTNETMWYFVGGIAAVVAGGLIAVFGKQK